MLKRFLEYAKTISIDCVSVCIYFLCMPLTIVETPFGSLLKVVTMPILVILAYTLIFGEAKKLSFNSVHLTYGLYILCSLLSLFLLANEGAVRTVKDMVVAYLAFLLMSIRVYNKNERLLIENAWILVGIYCTYLILSSSQVSDQFHNRTVVNIMGFSEDPNWFCAYFVVPTMIIMKRLTGKTKLKPLYITMLIMIFYSILKTGSRGGLIAVVLGIAVFIIIGVKKLSAKIGIFIAGILVAVIVVGVIFPLLPKDVQKRYSVESVEDDKGSGRFDIWVLLIDYTLERPERIIRGEGILSTEQSMAVLMSREIARAAHNQFVQVFADQGIIGMLFFLIFAASCFLRALKKNAYSACSFASIMFFAMSLTFYVFKPYVNVVIMCALTFDDDTELEEGNNGIDKKHISEAI